MRFHTKLRTYALKLPADRVASIAVPSGLVFARLEPLSSSGYEAMLDLVFEHGGGYLTLSNAIVDGPMTILRESGPVAWPIETRARLGDERLLELESFIEPWLQSRLLARCENDEVLRFFRDEPGIRADVEHARELGLLGAAPLLDVVRSIGPYVYAYRFSRDRSVCVNDARGANGAAFLFGRARAVAFTSGDAETDAFVRRWFSAFDFAHVETGARYDVSIGTEHDAVLADVHIASPERLASGVSVALARPLPRAVMVSNDPEDSAPDGTFLVAATPRTQPSANIVGEIAPVGGSAGRIVILGRQDLLRVDGADGYAARALESSLKAEGFSVRICPAHSRLEPEDADLVHVIGHSHAPAILPALRRLREAHVPIVTTPLLDDPCGEAAWGSQISLFALRGGSDTAVSEVYLDAIASRRLIHEGVPNPPSGAPVAPHGSVRELLDISGAVIAGGQSEAQFLRDMCGYARPIFTVPAYLERIVPANVDALTGYDDFILVHGPLDPTTSVLFVLLAAERKGLPVVFTGPVANSEYHYHLNAFMGDRAYYLPPASLSPEQLEGLYARARVYAEPSWSGLGMSKLARAGAYGAGLVASTTSHARDVWGELLQTANPGSIEAIGQALREAWDANPGQRRLIAARTAERCDQTAARAATAQAYQQAASSLVVP